MITITSKDEERITWTASILNEAQKRLYLAKEAELLGRGGVKEVARISGLHRNTISNGLSEIHADGFRERAESAAESNGHMRQEGAGRKKITELYPDIAEAVEKLISKDSFGNPMNPLRWTSRSLRNIAEVLNGRDYKISHVTVGELLEEMGYSLQKNQKMEQVGKKHPDRNAQFIHMNDTCLLYMDDHQPVISIDCKKKENVGNYSNNGSEYRPRKDPTRTKDHDWADQKAAPYGVYDIANNQGFVNVGISSDTAEFAVNSIRGWWSSMGKERFPEAEAMYITCDGGGSNGSRCRLWKVELQKLANELNIPIQVSHFPPGTSKWNKIEHRLFSQITKNWRGKPLETFETIVNLIASTTTSTGLNVGCALDPHIYETGIKVTDEELAGVNILRDSFHGDWNYTILPDRLKGDMD